MKVAFVGGGAHRLLGILRAALAEPGLFENGEIFLCDLNVARAQAMVEMVKKTPEYKALSKCKIWASAKLEEGLPGADMVGVVLFSGTPLSYELSGIACRKHGYIHSDNVSPNGAFLAIKGGPILLNIARQMEKHCPKAWLVDFANPIAVFSGMVNNHTKIKALGVCQGFTNHQWDLSRLLGKDEPGKNYKVEVAGVNHLSFIVKGSVGDKELFGTLNQRFKKPWKMPKMQSRWSKPFAKMIERSVTRLKHFYEDLDVLIFSTEGDGMAHLDYEDSVNRDAKEIPIPTVAKIKSHLKNNALKRQKANEQFQAYLTADLDEAFWSTTGKTGYFEAQTHDVFVLTMRAVGLNEPTFIVSSRLNQGAIAGIKDRSVVEYSQIIQGQSIKSSSEEPLEVPAVVHGLISGLAEHQTMLGDAIATEDPKLLAHALMAYPIEPYSKNGRSLYRELIKINSDQMAKGLREAVEYL
jgi:alpha-galactosidase/6-phospho-beta-glucosidase family protein